MENQTKNEEVEVEETLDLPETPEGEEDTTDWKAEAQKLRDKAISQRERTKALKRERDEYRKAAEIVTGPKKEASSQPKASELDETQLDYFDLKGYSDSEEVDVFHKIMLKTGMSAREVLKDEYALAKVNAIRDNKAVKNATPSATKRGGNQTADVASALAKFEQTGELPTDFALRTAVVNAKVSKEDSNKPMWHR